MKKFAYFILTALAALILVPEAASAESYSFKDSSQDSVETAKAIKDPQNKQKIFGRLESKNDVDYYTFSAEADEVVSITLLVPAADKDFAPSLIVFGPDLPKSDPDPVVPVGEGNGYYALDYPQNNVQKFFEDYLLTSFNQGPRLEFSSPKKSSYGLAVRSPNGNTGRYVLSVGQKDEWNWSEIFDKVVGILRAILRIY